MERNDVQEKALDIAIGNKRCGLGMSMGIGKTRVGLQHMIKNYNPMVSYLVVAPKKSIFNSWDQEMVKTNTEKMVNILLIVPISASINIILMTMM